MRYDDYEIDGDDDENTFTDGGNDQVAFLDYGVDGLWQIGIMCPGKKGTPHRLVEVIDQDPDINTLASRAVNDWGVDPRELWVSPCATTLCKLMYEMHKRV